MTQRVIEAIPLDKGDYKLDEVGKTALDLAWHIVGAEHLFQDSVVTGAFDLRRRLRPAHLDNSGCARAVVRRDRRDGPGACWRRCRPRRSSR